MKLDKDAGVLHYNDYITFSNIPKKIFRYEINGLNPLEWVVESITRFKGRRKRR